MFQFDIISRQNKLRARTGIFHTPHRALETPELAIVATEAEIRSVPKEFWNELPCKYLIVNVYHTYTKKRINTDCLENESLHESTNIIDVVETEGGIHAYMGLEDRTFATDSGGFQVFSLGFGQKHQIGKIARKNIISKIFEDKDSENPITITEDEVRFTYDGKELSLNPEISMELQHKLGADIIFAFDECTSPLNSKIYTEKSMKRTHRWLDRCIKAHKDRKNTQALFGIVQGGEYQDLREESARIVGSKDLSGFGIGGSFGDFKKAIGTTIGWVTSILPPEKPRHLLGIGKVRDIFVAVEQGVDLFDCVIPTREARHRMVYTKKGRVSVRKLKHLDGPIDKNCHCHGCRENVTTAQLWQWFLEKDTRAPMYTTIHNIWFFADLMREIRESIKSMKLESLKEEYFRYY